MKNKFEWKAQGKIPVKEKDYLIYYTGDGSTGSAFTIEIGQELIWEDVIGKTW